MSGKIDPITTYKIGSPKEAIKGLTRETQKIQHAEPEKNTNEGSLLRVIILTVMVGVFALFSIWFLRLFGL